MPVELIGKPVVVGATHVRSMLVLLNQRSGFRQSLNFFTATLQFQLDRAGIVYKVRKSPPEDLTVILRTEVADDYEAVAIVGGDGTIGAYINHVHADAGTAARWARKPIMLVPTGTHNSIAASLGMATPDSAVAALGSGRLVELPIWNCRVNGINMSLCASSINIGYYADIAYDAHLLRLQIMEFISMPMIKRRALWMSLYNTAFRFNTMECTLTLHHLDDALQTSKGQAPDGSVPSRAPTPPTVIEGPLRMMIASQLPVQHAGFSLTPDAEHGEDGLLHVTIAKEEASRMRMLHLLHKEAPRRNILHEDGVEMHTARRIELQFHKDAPIDEELEELKKMVKSQYDPVLLRRPTRLALLDGEVCPLPSMGSVVVEPTPTKMRIIAP